MYRGTWIAIALVAPSSIAAADPEGYQGGTGRAPGTEYNPGGDRTFGISVRGVTRERARVDSAWTCNGSAQTGDGDDVLTIDLLVANRSADAVETTLPMLDLVAGPHEYVAGGPCVRDGEEAPGLIVAAHRRAVVKIQFLVARGARPKILVWNDDDFPALFALPAAKRSVGGGSRGHHAR